MSHIVDNWPERSTRALERHLATQVDDEVRYAYLSHLYAGVALYRPRPYTPTMWQDRCPATTMWLLWRPWTTWRRRELNMRSLRTLPALSP